MRSRLTTKTLIISAIVFLSAGAAIASAHGGYGGWGRHGGYMMGPGMMDGYGPHMRGYYSRGNYNGALSKEDAAKLDQAREKFFKETRGLREQIEDKSFALRGELNKENPDAAKVTELQKSLSKLESEFDQKAIQHRLEVRKLLPDEFRGRGYYGRGSGGYCW